MVIRKLRFSFASIAILGSMVSAGAQQPDPEQEGQLRFRFVGPKVGNRIAAVAGVPGDASVYYAGAASGGVWKSTDGGNRWMPIFDKQPVAAIGALAVAPSDPSTVWAGTGEAWVIRDSDGSWMRATAGAGTRALSACAIIGRRLWLGSSDSAAEWALASDLGTGISDGCRWLPSKPSVPGGAAASTALEASTEALMLPA